jgi:hypothetical protein
LIAAGLLQSEQLAQAGIVLGKGLQPGLILHTSG